MAVVSNLYDHGEKNDVHVFPDTHNLTLNNLEEYIHAFLFHKSFLNLE